jgi:hypothetical protein
VLVGLSPEGEPHVFDEMEPRVMTFPESCEAFKKQQTTKVLRLPVTWGELGRVQLIEDKAIGPAIMQTLLAEFPNMVAREPGDRSKLARMIPYLVLWVQHRIWFPHPEFTPWVADYRKEIVSFPRGQKDDRWDTLTQALDWLLDPTSQQASILRAASKEIARALEAQNIWGH